MANLTVSNDIDTFMASVNAAAARAALGVTYSDDINDFLQAADNEAARAALEIEGWTSPESTSTPSGATDPTPDLANRYITLNLTSATNLTVTLTVPGDSSSGSIILLQHATTPVDVTWAVSAGSFLWAGTEPTWSSDPVSSRRIIAWRYDGSILYLAATEVFA